MSWDFVIKKRPLKFLAFLGGLRDFIIGLSFVLAAEEIETTNLYINFDTLIPNFSGHFAGWVFLAMGLIAIITSFVDKPRIAKYALWTTAVVWVFAGIMYANSGLYIHAFVFGLLFSLPAAFTAYHYHYILWWKKEENILREEIELLKSIIREGNEQGDSKQ